MGIYRNSGRPLPELYDNSLYCINTRGIILIRYIVLYNTLYYSPMRFWRFISPGGLSLCEFARRLIRSYIQFERREIGLTLAHLPPIFRLFGRQGGPYAPSFAPLLSLIGPLACISVICRKVSWGIAYLLSVL